MSKVLVDKEEFLKILDLIQSVNIHRKERLLEAKKTSWKLAEELRHIDYEDFDINLDHATSCCR